MAKRIRLKKYSRPAVRQPKNLLPCPLCGGPACCRVESADSERVGCENEKCRVGIEMSRFQGRSGWPRGVYREGDTYFNNSRRLIAWVWGKLAERWNRRVKPRKGLACKPTSKKTRTNL